MTRETKIPGPDHPITVEPSPDRVVVRAGGATIADSTATLVLQGADPAVRGEDAVWFYPEPRPAVEAIRDHVAFYPDRVEITVEAA